MVRDPNFWRRFSIAVHQDDAAKEEMTKRPNLKHSYVPSFSSVSRSPPLASPTSQSHLSPAFPPMAVLPSAPSPTRPSTTKPWPEKTPSRQQQEVSSQPQPLPPKRRRSRLQKTPSTRPLLRPALPQQQPQSQQPEPLATTTTTTTTTTTLPPASQQPRRPSSRHLTFHPHRHPTTPGSTLSLSLSGRPHSSFRFWTTITADPSHRDSWLESQKKKRRQRTWICWCFWLGLGVLVAGVVVTLVVLRGRGII
ncbi:Nn.00g012510.m01.CDS01 [Neocucurbitaria sp. VM-36]